MSGYRTEIDSLQLRHRPKSNTHESTGMLSRGEIGVSQLGQCDAGWTTDSFRGTRQMTTFKNDPMTRPNTPHIAATSAVTMPPSFSNSVPTRGG